MKKLIVSLLCVALASFGVFGDTTETTNIVDTYKFSASLNVPYLKGGVRSYTKQTLKGEMYVEYESDTSTVSRCYIVAQNKKTGVTHTIDFTDGFYNILGKKTKKSYRSTPSVYFSTTNDVVEGSNAHETIVEIQLAGKGALKTSSTKSTVCGVCSAESVTRTNCNILSKMQGSVTGVMDCICPEDEAWDHTVEAGSCGCLVNEDGTYVRSHLASFWGTWTARLKK